MSAATTAIVVASISAFVSFGTLIAGDILRRRSDRRIDDLARNREAEDKTEEARQLVARYRDPLLRSAFDLQSRIFNALRPGGFGGGRDPEYFRLSTLFVIAEFFGWLEIVRREMQFLDLGAEAATKELTRQIYRIQDAWATTGRLGLDDLYVYRVEQRAIGELMISRFEDSSRIGPQHECLGYASFVANQNDPEFARWFGRLGDAIRELPGNRPPRLVEVQHRLMDLVDLLDADQVRFPDRERL